MSNQPGLHTIEAYPIDVVKEMLVPWDTAECPIGSDVRRRILAECPVIVDETYLQAASADVDQSLEFTSPREISGYQSSAVELRQPSRAHQRSFELRGELFEGIWHDAHSNLFASYNLKGNNFSQPGIMEHPTAVDQYVAWGLQESKIIERVLKVSEVLRARNVSTEYIVGLAEPKEYLWPQLGSTTSAYERLPLDEYRRRIVQKYWQTLPEAEQTLDRLTDIQSKFNDMTFYVSMRATDTAFRLGDMISRPVAARTEVFRHINERLLLPDDKPLDPQSADDWVRYLQKYLAPELANNMARMHVDLAHDFLHKFNITALGGIVDADSVHGEPLGFGDAPITAEDRARDLFEAAHQLIDASPIDLANKTRFQTSWEFFANYIFETNLVLGDIGQARTQIGDSIAAIARMYDIGDPYEKNAVVLQSFQAIFLDRFFIQSEHAEQFSAQHTSFSELLANPSLIDAPALRAGVESVLSDIMTEVIEENVNEIQDPNFDIFALVCSGERNFVRGMEEAIVANIADALVTQWTKLANQHMPDLLAGLEAETIRTVFDAHIAILSPQLQRLAAQLRPQLQALLDTEIRALSQTSRSTPLLLAADTTYFYNSASQHLWAASEFVDIEDLRCAIKQQGTAITYEQLQQHPKSGASSIEITDSSQLYGITSNGQVDCINYSLEKGSAEVDVAELPTGNQPPYVLVTLQDSQGTMSHKLYLPEAVQPSDRTESQQDRLF